MRRLSMLSASLFPLCCFAYTPDLVPLGSIPRLQLDATQVSAAISELSPTLLPLHYAVSQGLAADATSGSWSLDTDGLWHWRLRIASTGAVSMAAMLDSLILPDKAELWFYTADGRDVQGPYTSMDNGRLLTPIVRSTEAVLDARMPESARTAFQLRLVQAFHGFRSLTDTYQAKGAFGDAGACTIDVACSDGDNWRNEIRSTVLITIAGTTLCSGSLVNNTTQDDRPLVLTANHCGINDSNVTQTRAYFNVQKSSCNGTTSGSVTQSLAGRSLLANSTLLSNTDYSLFELAGTPPGSFNAYYAGWDVSGALPSSGVGISHPAGDDKKISTFTSPPSSQSNICIGVLGVGNVCVGFTIRAWSVTWSHGATQGGSSGSGLWNQNHRIVATLSGGTSGCSTSDPSTSNGGADKYERLDLAWTAASATGTTLQSVLDPVNSGCSGIDGKNPGGIAAVTCASTPSPPLGSSGGSSGGGGGGGGGGAMGWSSLPLLLALLRRRAGAGRQCGSGMP